MSTAPTIVIDPQLEPGWVYMVDIIIQAGKINCTYRTTFNIKQPDIAIRRAIKHAGTKEEHVTRVSVNMVEKRGPANYK